MLHIARIAGVSITIYSVCKSNVRCLLIRKGHFQVELAQRPQDETLAGRGFSNHKPIPLR